MIIKSKDGNIIGHYQSLFPQTSFPEGGPSDIWLDKHGFVRSQEDLAAELRDKRNRLLAETDWMALSDNNMTAEWASYRQALRDVTDQSSFPHSVLWPSKPQ